MNPFKKRIVCIAKLLWCDSENLKYLVGPFKPVRKDVPLPVAKVCKALCFG